MLNLVQAPNKVSNETLELFRKVIYDDLYKLAEKVALERAVSIDELKPLIDRVLEQPIQDKLDKRFRDLSGMRYRKDLNRFTLLDLREISREKGLKTSGSREELIDRIASHIGLRDFSEEQLLEAKSFQSKPLKSRKKLKGNLDLSETPNHYVSDSE